MEPARLRGRVQRLAEPERHRPAVDLAPHQLRRRGVRRRRGDVVQGDAHVPPLLAPPPRLDAAIGHDIRRRHRVAGKVPERPAGAVGRADVGRAVAGEPARLGPRIARAQLHRHHRALDRHRTGGGEGGRERLRGQVHHEPAPRRVRVQRLAEGEPHRRPVHLAAHQLRRRGVGRRGVATHGGARRQPPVHLVRRVVGEAHMRQRRRRPRRRRADGAAVERQRVRRAPRCPAASSSAPPPRCANTSAAVPAAPRIRRPLLAPRRRVHVDGEPRRAGHRHRLAEPYRHLDGLAQRIGGVRARLRRHLDLRHRGRRCRAAHLPLRGVAARGIGPRQPPVHLVRRVVGETRVRQRRLRPRRRRADRAAVQRQRVPEHRDAPRRVVGLHHPMREHQRRRARAARIGRPLLAPRRRIHVDRKPRRAGHRHRLAEPHRHLDGLAQRIGRVRARLRRHLDPRYRGRVPGSGERRRHGCGEDGGEQQDQASYGHGTPPLQAVVPSLANMV